MVDQVKAPGGSASDHSKGGFLGALDLQSISKIADHSTRLQKGRGAQDLAVLKRIHNVKVGENRRFRRRETGTELSGW